MTLCTYAPLLACFLTTSIEAGHASYYASGIMSHTIEARIGWGHLPPDLSRYEVFAAVEGCDDIGREFLIQRNGQWFLGIATDCAGDQATVDWMQQSRVLVETDWETAVSWDMVDPGDRSINFVWILESVPVERCNIPL